MLKYTMYRHSTLLAGILLHTTSGKKTLPFLRFDFTQTGFYRNNLSQQLIRTELVRQKVDLGSVLISKKAFQVSGASFLPSGAFTGDIFARDFFAIKTVEASLSPPNIMILPQVLLFHQ